MMDIRNGTSSTALKILDRIQAKVISLIDDTSLTDHTKLHPLSHHQSVSALYHFYHDCHGFFSKEHSSYMSSTSHNTHTTSHTTSHNTHTTLSPKSPLVSWETQILVHPPPADEDKVKSHRWPLCNKINVGLNKSYWMVKDLNFNHKKVNQN